MFSENDQAIAATGIASKFGSATMSSIEIAELCDKRHANVLRDIKSMLVALELNELTFKTIYLDGMNREKPCFRLPRDLTMTLITGYNIPLGE